MQILKIRSKKTYTGSDGKEHNYYNYYLELDNGNRIQIKAAYKDDYAKLDTIAQYIA